jgi:hypothetical protein
MPTYANGSYEFRFQGGKVMIFQIKNSQCGSIYYRMSITGNRRIEGKLNATAIYFPERIIDMARVDKHPLWLDVNTEVGALFHKYKDRADRGLALIARRVTLGTLADHWIRHLEQEQANGNITVSALKNRIAFTDHYVKPYPVFRSKEVADIDDAMIREWMTWRDRYWISGPGSKSDKKALVKRLAKPLACGSKRKHATYLLELFEFVVEKKHIRRPAIPNLWPKGRQRGTGSKATATKRPHIDRDQWAILVKVAPTWITAARTLYGKQQRLLLIGA